jgi:Flp pilus assembly pilin Flp
LLTETSFPAAQTIGVAAIEVPSIATLITAAIARFFHTVCTIIDIILSLLFFASH